MDRQTESELVAGWRALSGTEEAEGWRVVPIQSVADASVFAGRFFPGNHEAVVVSFAEPTRIPPQMPEGRGFVVKGIELPGDSGIVPAIALTRLPAGSLELFSMMAHDCVAVLNRAPADLLLNAFLKRISAWQEFMEREEDALLSLESQTGLAGELIVLRNLLDHGILPRLAVESWEGPIDGIQDFVLGSGAIEAKSTLSPAGFTARIGSLDQLDDSIRQPLFVAAVRFLNDDRGEDLSEMVASIRARLKDSGATSLFEARLAHSRYSDAHASNYSRRLQALETKYVKVADEFPRLIHANVAKGVLSARYEIDLELAPLSPVDMDTALRELGLK